MSADLESVNRKQLELLRTAVAYMRQRNMLTEAPLPLQDWAARDAKAQIREVMSHPDAVKRDTVLSVGMVLIPWRNVLVADQPDQVLFLWDHEYLLRAIDTSRADGVRYLFRPEHPELYGQRVEMRLEHLFGWRIKR